MHAERCLEIDPRTIDAQRLARLESTEKILSSALASPLDVWAFAERVVDFF